MKIVAIVAMAMAIGLLSCAPAPDSATRAKSEAAGGGARGIVANLSYVRDSRTNLCFAVYYTEGHPYAALAAVATVPCGAVPAALLMEKD